MVELVLPQLPRIPACSGPRPSTYASREVLHLDQQTRSRSFKAEKIAWTYQLSKAQYGVLFPSSPKPRVRRASRPSHHPRFVQGIARLGLRYWCFARLALCLSRLGHMKQRLGGGARRLAVKRGNGVSMRDNGM